MQHVRSVLSNRFNNLIKRTRFGDRTHRCISISAAVLSRSRKPYKQDPSLKRWNDENDHIFGPKRAIPGRQDEKKSYSKDSQSKKQTKTQQTPPKKKLEKALQEQNIIKPMHNTPVTRTEEQKQESSSEAMLASLLWYPFFSKEAQPANAFIPQKTLEINISEYIEDKTGRVITSFFPSVTAILDKTRSPESQFYLDRWKQQMIEKLGEQGFLEYQRNLFDSGSNLHTCIEKHLDGEESSMSLLDSNQGYWQSLDKVLPNVTDVQGQEKLILHKDLHYRGKYDCIAKYRDTLCLIDWKTSRKPKPTLRDTYDNPMQVAAYLGAFNSCEESQTQLNQGAIVIAYEDGSPADVHVLNQSLCIDYWGQWLSRLHQYWTDMAQGKIK